jgi:hypothetical protein
LQDREGVQVSAPLALERVPGSTERPGSYSLETPDRGVLVGRFTIDNPCQIAPAAGEYKLRADSLLIVVSWPAANPQRLCPDVVTPDTYRFRIESLPAGELNVVFQDRPHGSEPRASRIFLPHKIVIR